MEIKVRFRGSKLALGSIRQPTATVDSQFFSRLTALNTILIGQNKKKYNRNGASGIETTSIGSSAINLADAVPAEKPVGSASGKAERGRPPKRVQESSSEIASLSVSKKQRATSLIPDIVVDTTVSRPTEGSLRLLPLRIPTDLISTGIGRHSNKINWNLYWNMWFPENEDHYFTPFSVDTHDLNLLVLQDIGGVVKGLLPKYSSDGLENSCHVAFDEEVIHSALQLWDDLASGKHYSSPLDTLIGELEEDYIENNLKLNRSLLAIRNTIKDKNLAFELSTIETAAENERLLVGRWSRYQKKGKPKGPVGRKPKEITQKIG